MSDGFVQDAARYILHGQIIVGIVRRLLLALSDEKTTQNELEQQVEGQRQEQDERLHKGNETMYARPLFLIATGPSRKGFPISELKDEGHFVMGINRVLREAPLNFAHFQDVADYWQDVVKYQDHCVAIVPGDTHRVEMTGNVVTFRYPRTRIPQSGSGMTGLFLAALMGLNPIFLVGYDYSVNGQERYQSCLNRIPEFKNRYPDVKVYNTCKGSRMHTFPFRDFDQCRHGEI